MRLCIIARLTISRQCGLNRPIRLLITALALISLNGLNLWPITLLYIVLPCVAAVRPITVINVKKLSSLKRLVRTTVAMSHN